jgi:hypothetical protein
VRLASALLIAATLAAGATAPAQAAPSPDPLQLSRDGVSWNGALDGAVFETSGALVPGSVEDAALWVRNTGGDEAHMRVSIAWMETSTVELARSMTLISHDSMRSHTEAHRMTDLARCDIVVPEVTLASGEDIRIDLELAMGDVDGQHAQNDTLDLGFVVAMQDAAAGAMPESACGEPGVFVPATPGTQAEPTAEPDAASERPGGLAFTGGTVQGWLIGVAAFLIAGALPLLVRRRRREQA